MTTIEWTDTTWNPTTGCNQVSPGCDNCYALTMAARLKAMASPKYQRDGDPATSGPGFELTTHPGTLQMPLRWSTPRRVFVNSMSDLFHDKVPVDFIAQVFAVMALTHQHTFQILTKRHARMRTVLSDMCRCIGGHAPGVHFRSRMAWAVSKANPNRISGVPDDAEHRVYNEAGWPLRNVWLGVSVEDQKWADIRIPALLDTPTAVRFLSCEPLLGSVNLERADKDALVDGGVDWVIAGGESGPNARPMEPAWARSLRDQVAGAGVPFFFKQWGEHVTRDQMPEETFRSWDVEQSTSDYDPAVQWRVGKKRAGNVLDGQVWDQYPEVR